MIVFPDILHADIDTESRKNLTELYFCFGADLDGDAKHEWEIISAIIFHAQKEIVDKPEDLEKARVYISSLIESANEERKDKKDNA